MGIASAVLLNNAIDSTSLGSNEHARESEVGTRAYDGYVTPASCPGLCVRHWETMFGSYPRHPRQVQLPSPPAVSHDPLWHAEL